MTPKPASRYVIPPFLLAGRNQVWFVQSGAVDVFLVDIENGRPSGSRRYVLRVEKGGALAAIAQREEVGLLACPVPGTHLLADTVTAHATANWRGALVAAIAGLPEELPEELDAFHHVTLETLVRDREKFDRTERVRLQAAAKQESAAVGMALRHMASPLVKGAAPDDSDGDIDPECLLSPAAQIVGKAMGIRIRSYKGMDNDGSMLGIAAASGFRVRNVALKGEWWKQHCGPLLVYWEDRERVGAALPTWYGGYKLHDPVDRTSKRINAKLAATFVPFAFTFYRSFPAKKLGVWDLLKFGLHGSTSDMAIIGMMGIASGLLGVMLPVAMGLTFDTIIPGADRTGIVSVAVFLGIAALASSLFELTRNLAVARMEGRMDAAMQAAVWDRILGLPVPFFRDYNAGDLAMRSLAISQIRQKLTGSTLDTILTGIFSLFSFALMFYYSWRLAMLGTALSVLAFLVPTIVGVMQMGRLRELSSLQGKISGMLLQFVSGIAKLRVTGRERRAFAIWARDFARQKHQATAAHKLSNRLAVFSSTFPLLCSGAIFYGNSLAMEGGAAGLTTGSFLAFHAAFFQFLSAALGLSSALISVLGVVPLFERAKPILEALPEKTEGRAQPGELTGDVEINHAVFRYRHDLPLVLRDLSIQIRAGEFVALVGASGCGKSTLFRLLLGFEKLESGAVHYDGRDLAGMNLQSVRRQIGVVLQNGQLQTGDIFQNIAGARLVTLEDAWEAARMSGLDDDIKAMPMGMHTVISEGGGGLSGGQRQRLMIARAIATRPRILLFDEATSALDNQTQAQVSRSLEGLQATRIVIAHRLSTIVNADRIYVLDGGKVAESGNYRELLELDGLFAKLAKRQLA